MNKKIIIDFSNFVEFESLDSIKQKLVNVLKTFLDALWKQTLKNNKKITAENLSLALYASFDSQWGYGDNAAAYLLAKFYFDRNNTIDISALLIHYFKFLSLASNPSNYESIHNACANKSNDIIDKITPQSLVEDFKNKLSINLDEKQAKYLLTFINEIDLKSPWLKIDEKAKIFYSKYEHFVLIRQCLMMPITNKQPKNEVEEKDDSQVNKETTENDILAEAKALKVW